MSVCLFIRLQVRQHQLLLEDPMFGVLKRKERRRLLEEVAEEEQQLLQCHWLTSCPRWTSVDRSSQTSSRS